MAERLKQSIIDKEPTIDLIAGPDSYRHLPSLLSTTQSGQTAGLQHKFSCINYNTLQIKSYDSKRGPISR